MRKSAATERKHKPGTTDASPVQHSEEVNQSDQQGYNETNPDAPVNPNEPQKQRGREAKKQTPPDHQ
ncbi:MAG: hypothetical protein MUD08_02750 [Cytophagales bacterium]|jgi:hypothetical protein|nr:hypothetical protein [Cytophagales bacterium]